MNRKKIVTALIVVATVVLAGIAVFTAIRLYQLRQQAVAPTAPESKPVAAEPISCTALTFTIAGSPTATPTATPTGSPTATPTGSPTATPTASPTATATATATPTGSPTATPIAGGGPAATGTSEPALPDAGISLPTILSAGFGVVIILASLLLVF